MSSVNEAQAIASWSSLGVKLPEKLTEAIDRFQAVYWTEVGHEPRIDIEAVTPDNTDEFIRTLAAEVSLTSGPLRDAKNRVLDLAASQVVNKAWQAIPEIIEKLRPKFDVHAKAYCEAARKLPVKTVDPIKGHTEKTPYTEILLAAGTEAVAAYQTAKQEAQRIEFFASWSMQAGRLTMSAKDVLPVLLATRPKNIRELEALKAAQYRHETDPAYKALNPALLLAAQQGIEFGLNSCQEVAATERDITDEFQRLNRDAKFH